MLQDAQRTRAPRAVMVSISTAVWTVMCSEPVTRAPASGCRSAYSARIAIRPGISCSARVISLRPKSARPRSATLKSASIGGAVVVMRSPSGRRCGSGEKAGVLVLLVAQPVVGGHVLRPGRGGGQPALDRPRETAVVAQPAGEPDLAKGDAVAVEQLAQGAQALQLARPVEAVAGRRAARLDEADALDVAQHPRRPAGGRRGLVDRERVRGHRETLSRSCQPSGTSPPDA